MAKLICVFCSANDVSEKYVNDAKVFSELIVEHGYGLVYGASDVGMMKVVASTVQKLGGRTIGITMEILKDTARTNLDELYIMPTLGERKAKMAEKSDVIVLLVGGIGSLDEVTELLELKKHKVHQKPIVVINSAGFYNGLKEQLLKMKQEGFINQDLEELVYFAETPYKAMEYIDKNIA